MIYICSTNAVNEIQPGRPTSARHPDPAVLGRAEHETKDPAQISERDLFFQTKMLAERLAFAAAKAANPPTFAARQPRLPSNPPLQAWAAEDGALPGCLATANAQYSHIRAGPGVDSRVAPACASGNTIARVDMCSSPTASIEGSGWAPHLSHLTKIRI